MPAFASLKTASVIIGLLIRSPPFIDAKHIHSAFSLSHAIPHEHAPPAYPWTPWSIALTYIEQFLFGVIVSCLPSAVWLIAKTLGDTESHADGVAQRGEVVAMVRLAAHAMHLDGAVWHDEQAVRVVRASVLGDHRHGPGMGRPQLLGNDVRTRDALSRISDDHRGADVDRHAHAHDAPVFRLVQGYGIMQKK